MKKFVSILLVLISVACVCAVGLAGCESDSDSHNSNGEFFDVYSIAYDNTTYFSYFFFECKNKNDNDDKPYSYTSQRIEDKDASPKHKIGDAYNDYKNVITVYTCYTSVKIISEKMIEIKYFESPYYDHSSKKYSPLEYNIIVVSDNFIITKYV